MAHTIDKTPDFDLLETILWQDGGYFLLDLHLARLSASAGHFGYTADKKTIMRTLSETARDFSFGSDHRVRLLVNKAGRPSVTHKKIEAMPELPVKVALSDKHTDRDDVFLYHKTTNRAFYDAAHAEAKAKGLFDIIFSNNEGEITEGAITSILVRKADMFFTPPVLSGLLPGVYRAHLLDSDEYPIKEKVLFKEDLFGADEIFVMNSVRKLLPARLVR